VDDNTTTIEITLPGFGKFVFGQPKQADYEDFQAKWAKSKLVAHAREFCLRALVEPTGDKGVEQLASAFARYAAVPMTIAAELEKLAGSEIEVSVRKK
jgi:hypothetical protein